MADVVPLKTWRRDQILSRTPTITKEVDGEVVEYIDIDALSDKDRSEFVVEYNSRHAAHVIAFFTIKSGDEIDALKAISLAYLAERESLRRFDYPIMSHDYVVSLPFGPASWHVMMYINGEITGAWNEIIDCSNHVVKFVKPTTLGELDELSDANVEVLESVWDKFGSHDRWNLTDYMRVNCPEWEGKPWKQISYESILAHLGKDNAKVIADQIW